MIKHTTDQNLCVNVCVTFSAKNVSLYSILYSVYSVHTEGRRPQEVFKPPYTHQDIIRAPHALESSVRRPLGRRPW